MIIDKKTIDFANHLADLSEKITLKYYRQDNGEIQKDDQSPVTKADREIEAALRKEIEENFPEHGIIGEEYGLHNENSDFQWIIDPIDGTSSFIIGRPTFGTLIALSYKNKPILGIMNQAINKERWLGVDGQGSWFNGKLIKTRNCKKISDSIISTTSPFFFDKVDLVKFEKLCKLAKYQKYGGVIYGGDCYSYALLASGFIDIIVEPNLQIYDYAALVPIISMAGGFIGDYEVGELGLRSNVKLLACASKELYDEVLTILK
jgi:histidinol phosphatase-like enzyme (inositol monophosphatase family)